MLTRSHTITFGLKFCQAQFESLLVPRLKFLNDNEIQLLSDWELTFHPNIQEIVFDFTITEWLSTEEVTIVFSWIRNLRYKGKFVKVHLPFGYPLNRLFSKDSLAKIEQKFHFNDNESRASRRNRRNIFLMINWGLLNNAELNQSDFHNLLEKAVYNARFDSLASDTFNKVVPFSALDASYNGELAKFDDHFKEVIKGHRSKNRYEHLFDLEQKVQRILIDQGCYSPFESKILSNVIFQELYLNACQHSFDDRAIDNEKECYMAMSFSSKKGSDAINSLYRKLITEVDNEALDFFKDKDEIVKAIQLDLSDRKFQNVPLRLAKLNKFEKLKDQAYLEYTFLDFGLGIPATLKDEFEKSRTRLNEHFSPQFNGATQDAQIIEFAMLLETSSIPISENIEHYNLIPRGLYFLIDMIRRYKGLLKIRSGKGKVIFDFSDKVYYRYINGKAETYLHAPYQIKDAVIHSSDNDVSNFAGTLYSIILPQKVSTEKDDSNKLSLSPLRLESPALNKYIYYVNKEKFPQTFNYTDLDPRSYEYISLMFLFNEVMEEYIQLESSKEISFLSPSLSTKKLNNFFYNSLYEKVVHSLEKHEGKNCVIFIDFAMLPFHTQLLKLIYYLLDTPRINEVTKAVFINIDPEKLGILEDIKLNIENETLVPLLFKPIPCFTFDTLTGLNKVKWIGLRDPSDEEQLTAVLFGERSLAKSNLASTKNIEGNMLYEFEGWVYSFLKPVNQDV